jgi:hypothetical protein
MADLTFEDYYNINPISVVDQNLWDDKVPEVILNFQRGPTIYTPLIDWVDQSRATGASTSIFTDLLEGDVDNDEIAITDQYIPEPAGVDSRQRKLMVKRYGDKVQYAKSSGVFQMWRMSGGRDWRPLLRGLLGNNVRRKLEILARNAHLLGPRSYWTYAGGAEDFGDLSAENKFSLSAVNAWNLRLGNIGTPIIPGTAASAKLAIVPPGVIYDFQESLAGASTSEAQMWRDASLYKDKLQYEIGVYKNIRFVECPNDTYGQNSAILYNAGPIAVQAVVKEPINRGDGCPDPENTAVDDVWYVGQRGVTHFITLADDTDMSIFELNDQVSIHTQRTSDFGVVNGVNFLSGKTIVRRIVDINDGEYGDKTLSFDRPIMKPYTVDLGTDEFAYVTKGTHVAFNLVLGSRGGIKGNVNQPLAFYEPKPVDDFESVWRYVWDIIAGYNIWEPSLFECHFSAVTLPKPGGVIAPPAPDLGS